MRGSVGLIPASGALFFPLAVRRMVFAVFRIGRRRALPPRRPLPYLANVLSRRGVRWSGRPGVAPRQPEGFGWCVVSLGLSDGWMTQIALR
ncbi:hypothetical protein HYPGJ_20989 [Hyphomicrobium sp. GJ21]|nr:hypothetical protein HYPGJ_20989 [Hyphomicrobium sp. GJ21]